MSRGSEAEDYLTFSPSLFDILTFVTHRDILNCQLTNKRTCALVKNNCHYLPKKEVRLAFRVHQEEDLQLEVLVFDPHRVHNIVNSVFISNGITNLKKTSQDLAEQYANNEAVSNSPRSFKNVGIGQALNQLLTHFCYRYQFYSIYFYQGDVPKDILNAICEVFQTFPRTLFKVIGFSHIMPGAQQLISKIDSTAVIYNSSDDDVFLKAMLFFTSLNREKPIRVQFQSNEHVTSLLKDWEDGRISLNRLEIHVKNIFECLSNGLKSMARLGTGTDRWNILSLTRSSDKKTLCVAYIPSNPLPFIIKEFGNNESFN